MKSKQAKRPTRISEIIGRALRQSGVAARVEQAQVVLEWDRLVGPQIAAVTEARRVTPDGTLFVDVVSSAWMNELALMQSTLLQTLNRGRRQGRIKQIRWRVAALDKNAERTP